MTAQPPLNPEALRDLYEALKAISDFWAYGLSQPIGAVPTEDDEERAERLGEMTAAALAKAETHG
jgi:hypothetical protein